MTSVSLIVPCYNETDSLPVLYEALCGVRKQLLGEYGFEFIFVNDGSKDSTLDVMKSLAISDIDVKYISFSRNFGKEAAMLAGMDSASGEIVGIIDADMQHSPALIPEMLSAITAEGYDVAAACRSDREGEAKFKSFLSQSFYKVINAVSEIEINQSAQDYRFMRRKVVDSILAMPEHDRFSKGIFTWVGFNVKWFEHENAERVAGQTKWSILSLTRYALDGITAFSSFPLKLPFFFSALSGLTSFALLIAMIIRAIVYDPMTSGGVFSHYVPTLLLPLAMMFLLGAFVFLALGVMGIYLGKVYTEAKGRPKYIISETNLRRINHQQ
ncbi:MAG: glycosyltransferase family 2 protein [Clostridia bacterium]|nr:glycosyltransferase family 2 protein [Clostridia bacterium]